MAWWESQQNVNGKIKAAAYYRYSADIGQENSVEIQQENIHAFAKKHGIEIIAEYADHGKSGLTVEGRPQFQELMMRVQTDRSFSLILVYDPSRWSRAQDTDISAYYESICKQNGKQVIFVTHGDYEPNQSQSLIGQLRTQIDRYQAAEYSRVLSAKTKDGAVKVAKQGYRPGGAPPYGMQRAMLDERKIRVQVLNPGQRKGLQNGRTILEPGDPSEIAIINEIFHLFVEQEYSEKQIAGHLNQRGVPSPGGRIWSPGRINHILSDEQYIGSVVYNKTSGLLKESSKRNPVEEWIVTPDSYDSIVPIELFDRARTRLLSRKRQFSHEEITTIMRSVYEKYGLVTSSLIRFTEQKLTRGRIQSQFGSIPEAFQSLYPDIVEDVKNRVFIEIANEARNVITYDSFLVVDEAFTVRIEPAMPMPQGYGYQWFFRQDMRSVVDITLGVPLSDEPEPAILGYFPLPRMMAREEIFCLSDLSRTSMEMYGYVGLDFIRELIRLRNQI